MLLPRMGLPWRLKWWKNLPGSARDGGLITGLEDLLHMGMATTPVLWARQRTHGYCPWGHKESSSITKVKLLPTVLGYVLMTL